MSLMTMAKLNDEYDNLCKALDDINHDLSNVSDLSYTWSLLVQEKARIQGLIQVNNAEKDKAYHNLKLSGY